MSCQPQTMVMRISRATSSTGNHRYVFRRRQERRRIDAHRRHRKDVLLKGREETPERTRKGSGHFNTTTTDKEIEGTCHSARVLLLLLLKVKRLYNILCPRFSPSKKTQLFTTKTKNPHDDTCRKRADPRATPTPWTPKATKEVRRVFVRGVFASSSCTFVCLCLPLFFFR